ncbi:MAG: zinc ribbon domain-containing protein [Deltaproteobacteria bacterium]|jgi:putative FmdB family regulatory protein|nr:zinc ribbon domain-containing protein [Deltaproteobacteria bacterium]
MPIYEYECAACGKTIEATQKITDPPLTDCPECGGSLRKLISLGTFQLKGSGWFVTDYKKKGEDRTTGPSASPDAKGGKGGDEHKGGKGGEEQEKRKSYLDQTTEERKSTVKEIVNKVADRM